MSTASYVSITKWKQASLLYFNNGLKSTPIDIFYSFTRYAAILMSVSKLHS